MKTKLWSSEVRVFHLHGPLYKLLVDFSKWKTALAQRELYQEPICVSFCGCF